MYDLDVSDLIIGLDVSDLDVSDLELSLIKINNYTNNKNIFKFFNYIYHIHYY